MAFVTEPYGPSTNVYELQNSYERWDSYERIVRTNLCDRSLKWIWTFKVQMCVPVDEIENGIQGEIERPFHWSEIKWLLWVVNLNEFLSKLNFLQI